MRSPFDRLRPFAPALLVLAGTECVSAPRPIEDVSPDQAVIVSLTDAGVPDMAPRLGPGVFLIGGRVSRIDSTSVLLAVSRTESTRGLVDGGHPNVAKWNGDLIAIPRSDIASVRKDGVSPALAWGIVGALAVAAVATIAIVAHNSQPHVPTLPTPQSPSP